MVGDGSFLMMAQEIVTAVAGGRRSSTIVLVQNHGFASIGALSRVARLAALRHEVPHATRTSPRSARGPRRHACVRATTLDELEAGAARRAPASPSCRSRPTRSCPRPDSEAWWDVPVAEVSGLDSTRAARETYEREQADPAAVPEPARESHAMTTVDLKTIQHRIGGAETAGSVDPDRPGLRPRHRRPSRRRSCSPSRPTSTPRSPPRARRFETLEGGQRRPPLAGHVRVPQPRRAARRRARADRRLRARQGRRGRQGRGHPRHGGRRVRLRASPQLLKGEYSDQVSDRRRLVLASASRSASARGSRRSTSR